MIVGVALSPQTGPECNVGKQPIAECPQGRACSLSLARTHPAKNPILIPFLLELCCLCCRCCVFVLELFVFHAFDFSRLRPSSGVCNVEKYSSQVGVVPRKERRKTAREGVSLEDCFDWVGVDKIGLSFFPGGCGEVVFGV